MNKIIAIAVLVGFGALSEVQASYEFERLDLNMEAQSTIGRTYVLTHAGLLRNNLMDFGRKVSHWGDPDFNDFIDRTGLPNKLGGQKKTGGQIAMAIYQAEQEYREYLAKSHLSLVNMFLDRQFFGKIRSGMVLSALENSSMQ